MRERISKLYVLCTCKIFQLYEIEQLIFISGMYPFLGSEIEQT